MKTKQEYVFYKFVIRFSFTFLTGIVCDLKKKVLKLNKWNKIRIFILKQGYVNKIGDININTTYLKTDPGTGICAWRAIIELGLLHFHLSDLFTDFDIKYDQV